MCRLWRERHNNNGLHANALGPPPWESVHQAKLCPVVFEPIHYEMPADKLAALIPELITQSEWLSRCAKRHLAGPCATTRSRGCGQPGSSLSGGRSGTFISDISKDNRASGTPGQG